MNIQKKNISEDATLLLSLSRSLMFKRLYKLKHLDTWKLFFKAIASFYLIGVVLLIPIALQRNTNKIWSVFTVAGKNLLGYYLGFTILAVILLMFTEDQSFLKLSNIIAFSFIHVYIYSRAMSSPLYPALKAFLEVKFKRVRYFKKIPKNLIRVSFSSVIWLVLVAADSFLLARNVRNTKKSLAEQSIAAARQSSMIATGTVISSVRSAGRKALNVMERYRSEQSYPQKKTQ